MKVLKSLIASLSFCMLANFGAAAEESNGLPPEVNNLNAGDVSYELEAKLPDLEQLKDRRSS